MIINLYLVCILFKGAGKYYIPYIGNTYETNEYIYIIYIYIYDIYTYTYMIYVYEQYETMKWVWDLVCYLIYIYYNFVWYNGIENEYGGEWRQRHNDKTTYTADQT